MYTVENEGNQLPDILSNISFSQFWRRSMTAKRGGATQLHASIWASIYCYVKTEGTVIYKCFWVKIWGYIFL